MKMKQSLTDSHALVGSPDLWAMKRRFQIGFLRATGLLPGDSILDLGCGNLRGGIPIIEYLNNGCYTGVDVRSEVLEDGWREVRESGLANKNPLLLHCVTLSNLTLTADFDVIWAFSVLIHMDDNILGEAIEFVARHLRVNGIFLGNVNIGCDSTGSWRGFPIVFRELEFYESIFKRHGLSVADIGPLSSYGHFHPRISLVNQQRQRMLRAQRI